VIGRVALIRWGTLALGIAGLGCSNSEAPIVPTQLVLTTPAAGAASGAAFTTQPVVAIRDAAGNTVTTDNGSLVTVTVSAGASVVGTAVAQALSGVATFANVGISGTGTNFILTFSRSGLPSATQSISLAAGPASQLVLTTPAAGAASGAAFTTQPVVAIRDATGNTVTTSSSVVTMAASGNGTVVGTATATAASGVGTFTDVGISGTAGTTYTLTFAASGLTSATQSIAPTPGAVATVTVSLSSSLLFVLQTQQLVAALKDASGNTVSGAAVTWSSSNTAVATVSTSGLVTGIAVGTATLTATSNGKTGTATIFVLTFTFTALSAGDSYTCGVTSAGAAYCWGFGGDGELGDGTTTQRLTPVAVQGGLVFTAVTTAKVGHSCGLTNAGAAYCWGSNANGGQLGDGTTTQRLTPAAVQGSLVFTALTAGGQHTCGVASAGAPYCWGNNDNGEIGDGTSLTNRLTPVAVQGGLAFTALSAGFQHTCGVTSAGAAYCWGLNINGQLGNGTASQRVTTPNAVGGVFTVVTAGYYHTCGLTTAGAAFCWGSNSNGQLGDGTTNQRPSPVLVQGGLVFTAVSAGSSHTCGLTNAGAVYCWGLNGSGQLGDGTTTQRLTPVAVQGGLVFAALSAGGFHTCGMTGAGAAYCWGDNSTASLGDGTTTDRLTPVLVIYGH
jgi:alpha-tubulin suppressor-like RCC1 family protein